jgi:hypothetical protein
MFRGGYYSEQVDFLPLGAGLGLFRARKGRVESGRLPMSGEADATLLRD